MKLNFLSYPIVIGLGLVLATSIQAQLCDAVPVPVAASSPTFASIKTTYTLPGLRGFTTIPTDSGTAYRVATFSGSVTHTASGTAVASYNPDTGEASSATVTTTTTTVTGASGVKTLQNDGAITDTTSLYGSTTVVSSVDPTTTTSYQYTESDSNPAAYWDRYNQYAASSDTEAALPNGGEVPFHKTREVYAYVQRFVTLLYDVAGNVTSATGQNASTGTSFDPYNDPFPWGPLIATNYEGNTGSSSIVLSGAFQVAAALATPTTGVATAYSNGQENSAYVENPPNWQDAQSGDNNVYSWTWASQTARFTASFPIKCPGKYHVKIEYGKEPWASFATSEEITFDDSTNAAVTRDIPIIDPAVGTTEPGKRYYLANEGSAEMICDARLDGDAQFELQSVHAGFYLGRGSGWMRIDLDRLYAGKPARPTVPYGYPRYEWIDGTDNQTKQFKSPDTLVVFTSATGSASYQMDFYHASQVGAKSPTTHFYSLSGAAYATYVVSNPDPTNEAVPKLRIQKTAGPNLQTVDYSSTYSIPDGVTPTVVWTFTNGAGTQKMTESWSGLNNWNPGSGAPPYLGQAQYHDKLFETFESNGTRVSATLKKYTLMELEDWTDVLTQEIADPSGVGKTTTYDYYYDPAISYWNGLNGSSYLEIEGNPGYGQIKQVTRPDGSWERYVYDASGKVMKTLRPFINIAPTSDESQCRVSEVIRSSLADVDGDGVPEAMKTDIELVQGNEIARTYLITWSKPVLLGTDSFAKASRIQCVAAGATWNDSANLVTVTYKYPNAPFAGESRLVVNPDGTAVSTVLSVDAQGNKTVEAKFGQPSIDLTGMVAGRRTVSTFNATGSQTSEANYDIASGLALESWLATEFDSFNRPTRLNYADGTFVLRSYTCCGLESETDRAGITTNYDYDAGRLFFTSRAGLSTRYEYDAAGRQTATYRRGSDTTEVAIRRDSYNLAGDVVSSLDALDRATTYSRSTDTTGSTTVTTTLPGAGTRIEVSARDGSLLSVSGTASPSITYEYGLDVDGTFVKETKVGDNDELTEWTKSYTDFAGRVYKVVYADGASSRNYYNASGQLARQVDPDGITMLYRYNSLGEQEYAVLDIDGNGDIGFGGSDRIMRTTRSVAGKTEGAASYVVRKTTTQVWEIDSQDTPATVSILEESSDGMRSWQTVRGLVTKVVTTFDGSGGRTVTTTAPDGVKTIGIYTADRLASTTIKTAAGAQLTATTHGYDPHGRLQSSTDARNGITSHTYYADDQIHTITTPDPDTSLSGGGYDAQITSYTYDSAGRLSTVTQPDEGVVSTTYWPTGAVKRTWGARTYPVEYAYDSQGRIKTLTTWQNFAGGSGTAVTTWNYDPVRGLLQNKRYADNTGPSYTYTPAGRLNTRVWARTPAVTTTYFYNAAGDVSSVDYDDATPDVGLAYDRVGRPKAIADGSGSRTLAYHASGQLQDESYTAGLLNGLGITRSFDSLNRLGGHSGTSLAAVAYAYDDASRLDTITSGPNVVTYGYVTNSPLIGTMTFKNSSTTRLTTAKTYDKLNRLSSVTNTPSTSSAFGHSYTYNTANQRSRAIREDNAYWSYTYDALGQITSGKKFLATDTAMLGHDFAWTFDDIGNRKTAVTNSATSIYTPTALNQYSQRTVNGAIDVLGAASATSTVTVTVGSGAPQATNRQGELFYKQVNVNNASAPQNPQLKITGVKNLVGPNGEDAVTEVTRNAFVAQTPETYSYDTDGNTQADSRWSYAWDGENRLIALETTTTAASAGVARQKLEFAYDGHGRRVSKKVSNWSGSAWTLAKHTLFFYDGWNLLAELDALSSNASIRTYVWGLDLSGGFQDAGGVGGLISVTDNATSGTHFAGFDGNGNVVGLVKSGDGTISAKYDYNAFGEPTANEGAFAANNPLRFSTKYTDAESGHLYYGLRCYVPEMGRWLSKDPIAERGGVNLYAIAGNNGINFFDVLGMAGSGHHMVPQAIYKDMGEEVKKFFDSDLARIFNEHYKTHGAQRLEGISAKEYNKLVSAELENFLGKQAIKSMTLQQAQQFLGRIQGLSSSNPISMYNSAVRREAAEAMKRALKKAGEQAAEKSLEKVLAAGGKKGGARLAKGIPLVGAVVAVYFIYDDSKIYGWGPAIASGGVDAVPLVGAGKILGELMAGERFLDVTVGPKQVQPAEGVCTP